MGVQVADAQTVESVLANWRREEKEREQGIAWRSEDVILLLKYPQEISIANSSLSQMEF